MSIYKLLDIDLLSGAGSFLSVDSRDVESGLLGYVLLGLLQLLKVFRVADTVLLEWKT